MANFLMNDIEIVERITGSKSYKYLQLGWATRSARPRDVPALALDHLLNIRAFGSLLFFPL